MRKFLSLGVAVVALVLAPAAEAHHVDLNVSTAACALVANIPTVTTSVAYRDFEEYNKPVHWELLLNGTGLASGVLTWAGPNYDHALAYPVAPGEYDVTYTTTWGYGNSATMRKHVSCPAPVPPPTTCNGVLMPPGTNCAPPPPGVYCNGVLMPAGTPPTACQSKPPCRCKPPVKHRCVPSHARLRVFPLRRVHGEVVFTLAGVRRAQVQHVTWSVRRHGGRWHRVGTSGRAWEQVTHRGLSWHVFLWVESVWGYPQWGRHQVKATARIKTRCGSRVVVRRLSFMNHDPEPRARAWEATVGPNSYGTG